MQAQIVEFCAYAESTLKASKDLSAVGLAFKWEKPCGHHLSWVRKNAQPLKLCLDCQRSIVRIATLCFNPSVKFGDLYLMFFLLFSTFVLVVFINSWSVSPTFTLWHKLFVEQKTPMIHALFVTCTNCCKQMLSSTSAKGSPKTGESEDIQTIFSDLYGHHFQQISENVVLHSGCAPSARNFLKRLNVLIWSLSQRYQVLDLDIDFSPLFCWCDMQSCFTEV